MLWGWEMMKKLSYSVDASRKAACVPAKTGLQWAAFFGNVEHEVGVKCCFTAFQLVDY
jgi:hypothetical protein